MADEKQVLTLKLDPEQLAEIKKNYLDTIERVIQERQATKGKMQLALKYITEAFWIFSKLHPESITGDAAHSYMPDLESEPGIISTDLLEAMQIVKLVFDSIQLEGKEDETNHLD